MVTWVRKGNGLVPALYILQEWSCHWHRNQSITWNTCCTDFSRNKYISTQNKINLNIIKSLNSLQQLLQTEKISLFLVLYQLPKFPDKVLCCSLWHKYVSTADEMSTLLRPTKPPRAKETCSQLLQFQDAHSKLMRELRFLFNFTFPYEDCIYKYVEKITPLKFSLLDYVIYTEIRWQLLQQDFGSLSHAFSYN